MRDSPEQQQEREQGWKVDSAAAFWEQKFNKGRDGKEGGKMGGWTDAAMAIGEREREEGRCPQQQQLPQKKGKK